MTPDKAHRLANAILEEVGRCKNERQGRDVAQKYAKAYEALKNHSDPLVRVRALHIENLVRLKILEFME